MVKSVLITGANIGLGKDTARQLAEKGAEVVYLGCRNLQKAEAAKSDLENETGKKVFEILQIDTGNLDSVRKAADALPAPVEALVMNAGGMGGPTPGALTPEGASHIFAINVLGHSLLVDELIKKGKLTKVAMFSGSEAARGVKQMGMKRPDLKTSSPDEFASIIDGSWFGGGKDDPMKTYGPSKYVAAMWMASMARKHPDIKFITMSPGGTSGTGAADSMNGFQRIMMKYIAMPMMTLFGMMHKLEDGAARYVKAVTDDSLETGRFYASADGKSTGGLVDQATIFADLGNEAFQDNANEAVHRFLG